MMTRRRLRIACGCLFICVALACLPPALWWLGRPPVEAQEDSLRFDGRERLFSLYVPAAHAKSNPVPLLLVLHGGGGDGRDMERLTRSRFNRLADEHGFIVAYPDAVDGIWNDGRTITRRQSDAADDVGFLLALIDHLHKTYGIDTTRVTVTGISNGAEMTLRLACEHPDRLAAIAPVANSLAAELAASCTLPQALPILLIHGDRDPQVPYGGGSIRVLGQDRGTVIGAEATARHFATLYGCAENPLATPLENRRADDTTATRFAFEGCAAPVAWIRVYGGGHTWPGGWQYLPAVLVGRTSRDFDAAAVMWDFFAAARP